MKPETISIEKLLESKLFTVSRASVKEENVTYERDVISHPGSAVIVPVFADKTVAMVRQYRFPAQKYLLELPAGSLEKGEDSQKGAERELAEEIGVSAGRIEKLTEFYVSPGFLSEKMYLFLAADLKEVGQSLEEDELIKVEKFSFPEAFELIKSGEIEDAKTVIGLIFAGLKFGFSF